MTHEPSQQFLASLRAHEGRGPIVGNRTRVYRCTSRKLTVGYGRNIRARPLNSIEQHQTGWDGNSITLAGAEWLLSVDASIAVREVNARLPWVAGLDPARRDVVYEMAYQMGIDGMMAFTRTLALIRRGRYIEAAHAMGESLWAKQTPARVARLQRQMAGGDYWMRPTPPSGIT
jgi:lysozyme